MKATFKKYVLNFKRPAGTSRGVYHQKDSWFILLTENEAIGIGECSILPNLSIDHRPDFEEKLAEVCQQINCNDYDFNQLLIDFPAIQFGLETALLDLKNGGQRELFPSDFTQGKKGIQTNGLIWMGDLVYMEEQLAQKIEIGFSCIKLKIGALNWKSERKFIEQIRSKYSSELLTIRVDANGAYNRERAIEVLHDLAALDVHSIEQPIQAGQWETMAELCDLTPTPIALDEELIGAYTDEKKFELLEVIRPQYIILKPCLVGGFKASDAWINIAEKEKIGWWATSALESNIGLNAIAQWVFTKNVSLPQGLGTGSLFANNIESPLEMHGENLYYTKTKNWST